MIYLFDKKILYCFEERNSNEIFLPNSCNSCGHLFECYIKGNAIFSAYLVIIICNVT